MELMLYSQTCGTLERATHASAATSEKPLSVLQTSRRALSDGLSRIFSLIDALLRVQLTQKHKAHSMDNLQMTSFRDDDPL